MYNTRNELWQEGRARREDHIISQTVCGHTYNDSERGNERRILSVTSALLVVISNLPSDPRTASGYASFNERELFSFSQAWRQTSVAKIWFCFHSNVHWFWYTSIQVRGRCRSCQSDSREVRCCVCCTRFQWTIECESGDRSLVWLVKKAKYVCVHVTVRRVSDRRRKDLQRYLSLFHNVNRTCVHLVCYTRNSCPSSLTSADDQQSLSPSSDARATDCIVRYIFSCWKTLKKLSPSFNIHSTTAHMRDCCEGGKENDGPALQTVYFCARNCSRREWDVSERE